MSLPAVVALVPVVQEFYAGVFNSRAVAEIATQKEPASVVYVKCALLKNRWGPPRNAPAHSTKRSTNLRMCVHGVRYVRP